MLTGKRVAVIGAGRSGLAAALALQERGAQVAVFDRASAEALATARQQLAEAGIPFYPNQDIPHPLTGYHLIVVSPGLPPSHPLFAEAARVGVPVWGEIELAYQIAQAPLIAITGTNGKTTSTMLTHHMLTTLGYKAHLCGNVAGTAHDLPLVSAAHRAQPDEWLVAEVSSFQLLHTHQFRPHIAVITNITEDHLNYHGSWEAYARAKGKILHNLTEHDWAILNARDRGTAQLLHWLQQEGVSGLRAVESAGHVRYFARENPLVPLADGTLDLSQIPTPALIGEHALENALVSAHVASILGATCEQVAHALATFQGVPHRMERVAEINGVLFINNSMCTNATALEHSLQATPKPCIAIAGGIDKNQRLHALADSLARHCRYVLLIGRDGEAILSALHARGYRHAEYVGTLEQAVPRALQLAQSGEAVILAPGCASFDQFRDFIERGERFKTLVRRYAP